MPDYAELAERAWRVLEPVHGVTYFAPESRAEGDRLGLKGHWMSYFAFRSAPMGAVPAAVVEATFFNFHRSRVERAIPEAFEIASPAELVEARWRAVSAALGRVAGEPPPAEALELAQAAAGACDCAGRPLAAANRELRPPDDEVAALWQAITVLREFRGDGHTSALVHAGLDGAEALVLQAASGRAPRDLLIESRRWPESEWSLALGRLASRGLVGAGEAVTGAGRQLRDRIEAETNALAAAPYRAIGEEASKRLVELVRPLARAVVGAGLFPPVNPIGLDPSSE